MSSSLLISHSEGTKQETTLPAPCRYFTRCSRSKLALALLFNRCQLVIVPGNTCYAPALPLNIYMVKLEPCFQPFN